MSCEHTPEILADHFDTRLADRRRLEVQRHLAACTDCAAELAALDPVRAVLGNWREQRVPQWTPTAGAGLVRPSVSERFSRRRGIDWLRWVPVAASLVLTVAVVLQLRVEVTDGGWQVSFGAEAAVANSAVSAEINSLAPIEQYLQAFSEQQRGETQQLIETALTQFGETSADSLYQIVSFFEEQRRLDMQRMEAGFQQMLDRDYQTVNSVQQLATYVQYQGELQQ